MFNFVLQGLQLYVVLGRSGFCFFDLLIFGSIYFCQEVWPFLWRLFGKVQLH